jgi:predicted transcriptional regulator
LATRRWAIKQIARELGVARNTVRRYLRGGTKRALRGWQPDLRRPSVEEIEADQALRLAQLEAAPLLEAVAFGLTKPGKSACALSNQTGEADAPPIRVLLGMAFLAALTGVLLWDFLRRA